MKKVAVILIAVCLLLALTACSGSTPVQNKLERNWLMDLPINSYALGERLTYDVITEDGTVGTMTQTYKKVQSATIGPKEFSGVTAYLLETEITCGSDFFEEALLFSAGSSNDGQIYPPLASYATKFVDDKYSTEYVLYDGNKVEYYFSNTDGIPQDAEPFTTSLKAPYYDNMQLYTVLRAAGLDAKNSLTVNVPLVAEKQVAQIACAYVAGTSVTSHILENGAGKSFECSQISLSRSQTITGAPSYVYLSGEFSYDGHKYKNVPVKIVEGTENIDGTVSRGSVYVLKSLETFDI